MPVEQREGSQGQVLRGVCPACGQVTKRRDAVGSWVSKCAHPGARYEGRMMPGGKKTVPKIPETVDPGRIADGVAAAVGAEPVTADALERVRGMVDRNEPRADERAVADAASFPVRAVLRSIGESAQGLASALLAAQGRIRDLERLIADAAVENVQLRGSLEAESREVARLTDLLEDPSDAELEADFAEADARVSSDLTEAEAAEALFDLPDDGGWV